MIKSKIIALLLLLILIPSNIFSKNGLTEVRIINDKFLINGEFTYNNRTWNGYDIEGLLMNSRMVQGIFDDLNPQTSHLFAYPDTGIWDPERNTDEFIEAMKTWKKHGLLAFTLNLQGGSPFGYKYKPVINSTFNENGELRPDYMKRLKKILDAADQQGMVVILGYFYIAQDGHLKDESAILKAVDSITQWILDNNYRNILIEVANECDLGFHHEILKASRIHELITRIKNITRNGRRLLVSTSFSGGHLPTQKVAEEADFILLHGNGMNNPQKIPSFVQKAREMIYPKKKPILFNEDDHFDFEKDTCNFSMAIASYASWGYFDYRFDGEGFNEGFQSVPVDWNINSDRKKGFFTKLKEVTGYE